MQQVCSRVFIVTVRFDVLRVKHARDELAKQQGDKAPRFEMRTAVPLCAS